MYFRNTFMTSWCCTSHRADYAFLFWIFVICFLFEECWWQFLSFKSLLSLRIMTGFLRLSLVLSLESKSGTIRFLVNTGYSAGNLLLSKSFWIAMSFDMFIKVFPEWSYLEKDPTTNKWTRSKNKRFEYNSALISTA